MTRHVLAGLVLGFSLAAAGCSSDHLVIPIPAPTLGTVATPNGVQGTTVVVALSGTNFVPGATTVVVSGTGVSVSSVTVASPTSASASLAIAATAQLGTHTVAVITPGGTSGTVSFTVTPPAPTLAAILPGAGVQGTTANMSFSGTNFLAGATTVNVSGTGITVQNVSVSSPTTMTADFVIASGATLADRTITVTTAGGTSGAQTFSLKPPPPTVTAVSPANGVVGTIVSATLTGTNFVPGAIVVASGTGVVVTDVAVASSTSITAKLTVAVDASLGARTLTVTTAGGTTTSQLFTVLPPAPTTTGITPASGIQGTAVGVTIAGTNFVQGATSLAVSGAGVVVSNLTVTSGTSLTATFTIAADAPVGTRAVTVTTAGGATATLSFAVNLPAPTLTSVSPPVGVRTSAVAMTLTGTNFVAGGTAVTVAGTGVTVTNVNVTSTTTLTATFSLDAAAPIGDRAVTVTTVGGTSNPQTFTVLGIAPTISSILPTAAALGATVTATITGTNFAAGATVQLSGTGVTAANVIVGSATSLTVDLTVAANAALGARNVTVTANGRTSNAATFTVNPQAPTLVTVAPNTGAQGGAQTVTLTGTNFVAGASILVSGSGVTVSNINVVNGTTITADFSVAAGATLGARTVSVTTSGGTTGTQTFTIIPPPPTLGGLSLTTGAQTGTQTITLTGTNFQTGATTVDVSPANVTVSNVNVASSTSLTADFAVAPGAALGARTVSVTTAGGTSGTQNFTVIVPPTITTFAAAATHVTIVQPTTLALTTSNAATCSINNGVGTVGCSSSTVVTPGSTKTFTATATSAGASVNASSSVFVNEPGRWVYSSAANDDNVHVWTMDGTGDLTAGTSRGTANVPQGVAVDPNGRYVYVADGNAGGAGRVSQFSIDQTTGALTPIGTGSVAAGNGTLSLAVDPTARFVYALNNNGGGAGSISPYTIASDGSLVANGAAVAVGTRAEDIAIDALGRYVYSTNRAGGGSISMFTINSNGTLTANGTLAGVTNANGIAADPTGRFVYATERAVTGIRSDVAAFVINANGTLTAVNTLPGTGTMEHIAVDPTGRFVYATDLDQGIMHEYSINQVTGALTEMAGLGTGNGVHIGTDRIAVDPQGKFVYTANFFDSSLTIFTINQSTGALTVLRTITTGVGSVPSGIAVSR